MSFYLCFALLLPALVAAQAGEELYQLLAKDHASQNLIISPYSIDTVLSLVYMGAAGGTATELQAYLKLPTEDKQLLASKHKQLLEQLLAQNATSLKLANRIYVNERFSLKEEYNQVARDSFHADAQTFGFAGGVDPTVSINKWIMEQTNGKIVDLLQPSSITTDEMAVLVNAIHFKGQWQSTFDANQTREGTFWVSPEESVTVPMMSLKADLNVGYFPDLQARVLELPYLNSNLSMWLFLPKERDGLADLEAKISGFSRRMHHMEAIVKLPKFQIEFGEDLKETLKTLGVRELFSDGSDLSELFANNSTGKISKFAHKALLEVNEEGAEATAATYGMITNRAAFSMSFHFDHPFAFVIRDERTIYFQGHVVKP
ncbi:serine protease inhibitor 42Dd [Drosophila subobscura]|uniref:serine protease inhibitor 42Dd n=1 Tax=Drosophila subobscura TaxID=7241 RepID=UPI00155AD547|nr:serine protease inhibitor 42Dd [Drosophila subobscura]